MVEESESSITMANNQVTETLNVQETLNSNEATIASIFQGGTESTCNNNKAETSALTSDGDGEKSLEFADELMDRGSKAIKEGDFDEATDCFSRALEIRTAHYGELAFECVKTYYKYGCALLYKAQEEADPLGIVPKRESQSHQDSDKDRSIKNAVNGESSTTSVSSKVDQDTSLNHPEGETEHVSNGNDQVEDDEDSDDDDVAEVDEVDEEESDLDLAWKMLDVARAIVEKQSGDTMDNVDILSALAEVALEREDIETSLSDYKKALSILERLVEPDNRQIAELNFRICLCLEIGSMAQEAIPYCQKAISVCKSRVQRLMNEVKNFSCSATSTATDLEQSVQLSSSGSHSDISVTDKEAEIETLIGLSGELETKLEDLQQLVLNPKSILAEIMGMAAKAKGEGKSGHPPTISTSRLGNDSSTGDFDSPTVSTAHTNGTAAVTDLGVVGRGVKRVLMNPITTESSPTKKPSLDSTSDKRDGNAS